MSDRFEREIKSAYAALADGIGLGWLVGGLADVSAGTAAYSVRVGATLGAGVGIAAGAVAYLHKGKR